MAALACQTPTGGSLGQADDPLSFKVPGKSPSRQPTAALLQLSFSPGSGE